MTLPFISAIRSETRQAVPISKIFFRSNSGTAADKRSESLKQAHTPLPTGKTATSALYFTKTRGRNSIRRQAALSNITEVKPGTIESKGNASFRLVEVDDYYNPIAGGGCYDVDYMEWDTICIPDCTGKVCGTDGCSSVCGTCGKNEGCSLDQSQCQPLDLSDCTGISIDFGTLKKHYSNSFETSMADGRPYVYMTFFLGDNETKIKQGTYDLGSDKNLDYKTCTESVKFYSGYNSEFEYYTRMYFQHGGTINVESVGDNNTIKGTINAKFVLADIAEDYSTTFFAGTKCLEIETSAFDVANSHDPVDDPGDECFGQKECDTNADCDPGYACDDGCWCYIENPDVPDTSDSGSGDSSPDTGSSSDTDSSDSGSHGDYGDTSDSASNDSGSNDSSDSGSNNSDSDDTSDKTSSDSGANDAADSSSNNSSSQNSDGCSVLTI